MLMLNGIFFVIVNLFLFLEFKRNVKDKKHRYHVSVTLLFLKSALKMLQEESGRQ